MGVFTKSTFANSTAFVKAKASEKPIKYQQNRAFTALYKVQLLPKSKRVCSVLF